MTLLIYYGTHTVSAGKYFLAFSTDGGKTSQAATSLDSGEVYAAYWAEVREISL